VTPKDHIELIQLETRLIRARLQLKAAIAYRPAPNATPEQKEAHRLMVACARLVVEGTKEAIAMHNWGFHHAN